MGKKLKFLVVDTETATLDFANDLAGNDEQKKRIAIARPLVYDIGWCIVDRAGNTLKKASYLVAETFSVPSIFNTAYYKEKRPLYLEAIKAGETSVQPWETIMQEFIADLQTVSFVGAYNMMFDQRAINYTDLYIKKLYSSDFYRWYEGQKWFCAKLVTDNGKCENPAHDFDPMVFKFRGDEYPNFDVWGIATEYLLNTNKYKQFCIDNNYVTASGKYFKTSAETAFRFLFDENDFDEAHTALADAEIEAAILGIMFRRKKGFNKGITYFPFRTLGTVNDFINRS